MNKAFGGPWRSSAMEPLSSAYNSTWRSIVNDDEDEPTLHSRP